MQMPVLVPVPVPVPVSVAVAVPVIVCRFVVKSSQAPFSKFYNFSKITSYGALSKEILYNVHIAIRIGFSECVTT